MTDVEVHEKPDIWSLLIEFSSTVYANVEFFFFFPPGFSESMSFEGTAEFVK